MDERGRAGRDAVDRAAVGVEQDRARAESPLARARSTSRDRDRPRASAARSGSPTWRGSSRAPSVPCGESPARWHSASGSAEAAGPAQLRVEVRRRAEAELRAGDARERRDERAAARLSAPRNWPRRSHGRPAGRSPSEQIVNSAVRLVRHEPLPGAHDLGRLRPRPAREEVRDRRRRMRPQHEVRDDAEVAAAAPAAGPEEVAVAAWRCTSGGGRRRSRSRARRRCRSSCRTRATRARRRRRARARRCRRSGRSRSGSRGRARASAASTSISRAPAPIVDRAVRVHRDAVQPPHVDDEPGRRRVARVAVPARARGDADAVAPRPARPPRCTSAAESGCTIAERLHGVEALVVDEPRVLVRRVRAA